MRSLLSKAGRHFAALAFCAAALFCAADAFAQGAVQQSGPATPGHGFLWVGNGVAADAGPANGGQTGVGLSELNITQRSTTPSGYQSTPFCINDAPITSTNGYHQLCLGPNATTGGGVLSYNAYGLAAQLPFSFSINGTTFSIPTGGYGNVNGPVSSTVGHLAVWNNTGGTLLADLSILGVGQGGTGGSSWTANLPLIGNGSGALSQGTRLGNTTKFATTSGSFVAGDCLQLDSGLNIVDATFPCSSGTGSGTVASGSTNNLAYYPSNGTTVTGLATANSGVLVTDSMGVPSIGTTLPSGITGANMVLPGANVGTTDDTSTNATYYPTVQTATGGNNPLKTSSSKLTYNPSTGGLAATNFAGKVQGLTVTPTTGTLTLSNSKTLTVGNSVGFTGTDSTSFVLPGSSTTLAGLGTTETWTGVQTFGTVIGAVNPQVGTTYTIDPSDCGKMVIVTNGSAIAVTLPNSLVIGCAFSVVQGGTGQITFSAASGAAYHNKSSFTKTSGQYAGVTFGVDTNSGGSSADYIMVGDGA